VNEYAPFRAKLTGPVGCTSPYESFTAKATALELTPDRLSAIVPDTVTSIIFPLGGQSTDGYTEAVITGGVLSMLTYLKSRGKLLGVATGNLEKIGWLKIEIAGLRDWFSFGGFSDRHAVRTDMIAHALAAARKLAGAQVKVCVVGDTPSDIAAARANGLPTIAVATGVFPYQTLLQHQPEVCTSTLQALL